MGKIKDKHRMFRKITISSVLALSVCLLMTACQKQTGDTVPETDVTDSDNRNCSLISETTQELTFDEVVERKQSILEEEKNQIADTLSEKERQIRSELDEKGENGQEAVIHYFLTNGTFVYSGNEDYQIGLSAVIVAVDVPNEKRYIHSVDESYSMLVSGKHNAVWQEAASDSTISVYKGTVRLAAAGFVDIYEDHAFEEPGFSLCESEPVITLTSETMNPVLVFELPK